jgi:septal ring factor EnvC (AmiA/AmiB activator)
MKELIGLKEQIALIEAEMKVISDKILEINKELKRLQDQELEIKAIKLFLKRTFTNFNKEYPEILKKLGSKE